tara:strand:+ start:279 stop:1457 length:1179 start_codon:yes stop_codon:yes gene_type:complete
MSLNRYSDLSKELTSNLSKEEKKSQGIYFTPPECVNKCIEQIKLIPHEISSILEPSCGSGEFISSIINNFHKANINGIEYNTTIYDSIKNKFSNVAIDNEDFIDYESIKKFDLIIGNPPYFVMKKDSVDSTYFKYFDGRPNIFILFILKSLDMLTKNGILCFVLPKNFLNCLYYDKTRKYIIQNFTIVEIFDAPGNYIETQQDTIVMIVQNKQSNNISDYVSYLSDYTIFGTKDMTNQINSLLQNSTTLENIGFKVSVGNIVWNQNKSILTDDYNETRLIYSSDIKNGIVGIESYKNEHKKNYIKKTGKTGKILLVNRGYGVGNYKFEFCLYESKKPYLIENHLICITGPDDGSYEKIVKSLSDKRTKEFIEIYFCNNGINTTELSKVLPIY